MLIEVARLRVGVFVHLDLSWTEHPFPFNSFKIRSQEQIDTLRKLGLAKGGFSGVGQIAVPLLAVAVSPVQAAAILLPILLVQDAVGVWAFRHDWDAHILKVMVPGAALGIFAGYVLASWVSVTAVLATAVAFVCQIFAQRRLGAIETVIILALEPVVAAAVSLALGAEPFTWALVAGGALLILAMVLAQVAAPGHSLAVAPPQS